MRPTDHDIPFQLLTRRGTVWNTVFMLFKKERFGLHGDKKHEL
jgi:hypothetical protein